MPHDMPAHLRMRWVGAHAEKGACNAKCATKAHVNIIVFVRGMCVWHVWSRQLLACIFFYITYTFFYNRFCDSTLCSSKLYACNTRS